MSQLQQSPQIPFAEVKPHNDGYAVERHRADGKKGLTTYHASEMHARRAARRWTGFAMRRLARRILAGRIRVPAVVVQTEKVAKK